MKCEASTRSFPPSKQAPLTFSKRTEGGGGGAGDERERRKKGRWEIYYDGHDGGMIVRTDSQLLIRPPLGSPLKSKEISMYFP